jgi:hypothetical protein
MVSNRVDRDDPTENDSDGNEAVHGRLSLIGFFCQRRPLKVPSRNLADGTLFNPPAR